MEDTQEIKTLQIDQDRKEDMNSGEVEPYDGSIEDRGEEYETVDNLADKQKLINCYQMQIDDNNECTPVYLGRYPDVPLPVNHTMRYKKYVLHYVTYVLTEEEIQNRLFKIVGVNVFRQNRKSSMCSLDLVKGSETGGYELLFNDHKNNKTTVVEKIEKFPGKDKVLEYIIKKTFEEPVKTVLIR